MNENHNHQAGSDRQLLDEHRDCPERFAHYDAFKNDMLRQWPMNNPLHGVTLDEVTLDRERKAWEMQFERRLLEMRDRARVEDILNRETGNLIRRVTLDLYGESAPQRHVIRYPADWWQAVKERFAPAWFLDRYPVVFTEVTASLHCTYPDFVPSLPDSLPVIRVAVWKKPETYCW